MIPEVILEIGYLRRPGFFHESQWIYWDRDQLKSWFRIFREALLSQIWFFANSRSGTEEVDYPKCLVDPVFPHYSRKGDGDGQDSRRERQKKIAYPFAADAIVW